MKKTLNDISLSIEEKKIIRQNYIEHITNINQLYSEIKDNIDNIKEYYLEEEPDIRLDDLNFIVENAGVEKIKGGAGSNTPTREEAIALKDFTEKRMEQDQRRKEAEEKGEPFDEEPYVHPNVVQREINDETLDESIDYIKEKWQFTEFHIQSRSKNTPILGMTFKGRVVATISGKYALGKHLD